MNELNEKNMISINDVPLIRAATHFVFIWLSLSLQSLEQLVVVSVILRNCVAVEWLVQLSSFRVCRWFSLNIFSSAPRLSFALLFWNQTCTRSSRSPVFAAISCRLFASGYLCFANASSNIWSCSVVNTVRFRRFFSLGRSSAVAMENTVYHKIVKITFIANDRPKFRNVFKLLSE